MNNIVYLAGCRNCPVLALFMVLVYFDLECLLFSVCMFVNYLTILNQREVLFGVK
jgi:hypothetical protein